jgi:multidrug efflux pump subunit AcrB
VKNIESQTLAGVSVIRIFFQPNVRIDSAIAQVTAVSQTILRRIPPRGTAADHHPLQRLAFRSNQPRLAREQRS